MYYIETKKRKNSRNYSPVRQLCEIPDVLAYLKENNVQAIGKPYIFSHINLSDGSIITQKVGAGLDRETGASINLICSPEMLARTLGV